MRILWTLAKVILALAIAIPLGMLAVVGFVGYGVFLVARKLFGHKPKPSYQPIRELPAPDPYYEAAMRELDAEMRNGSGR